LFTNGKSVYINISGPLQHLNGPTASIIIVLSIVDAGECLYVRISCKLQLVLLCGPPP